MTDKAGGALLRANAVFKGVPAKEIEGLIQVTQTDRRRPREFLFEEGDAALWLFIVKTGRVKILKHSRAGKDVVLELLGPGEIFGGVAVLEKRPYPATAQAMETTEVLKIPSDALLALSERHPSIVREMALTISRRLRTAHESVKSLAVEPVEPRLAATLMRLADREGKPSRAGVELPYHLTRQSLADMAGTTVETTIRVVSRWIKEGLVVDDRGRLVLKRPPALRAMAQGEPQDS
jgi:CRP/FNR family transcriptional regulator